jgi:hypothetical protein
VGGALTSQRGGRACVLARSRGCCRHVAARGCLWRAKVFDSRSHALQVAFPDAERIEDRITCSRTSRKRIVAISQAPLDSKLVKIYRGFHGDQLLGYAVIDIHNVRTMPEAFMVVLTPEGSVRSVRVLAFHEPLDYLPTIAGMLSSTRSRWPRRCGWEETSMAWWARPSRHGRPPVACAARWPSTGCWCETSRRPCAS